jgi:hypothetical protein
MIGVFLAEQRAQAASSPAAVWSVAASAHAARWALGCGESPSTEVAPDRRESRALAVRYGRIPGSSCLASPGTFGHVLACAVTDEFEFQRLFAPFFGAGLFGLPRADRQGALDSVPNEFGVRVRREFEVIRSRGARPVIESTGNLFDGRSAPTLRSWIGARVAGVLGHRCADELSVLCGGWEPDWRVPSVGMVYPSGLVATWLSLFEECE